jgi:signal transduction histidine kinase
MNAITTSEEIQDNSRHVFGAMTIAGVGISSQPGSLRAAKCLRPLAPRRADWIWNLRLEERRNERVRIARELHDTLLQGVIGASMMLDCAAEEMPTGSPGRLSVSRALRRIQGAIGEARAALQGLRSNPAPAATLEKALSELRDEFASNAKGEFRIVVRGLARELPAAIQEQIYLVGREALLNAFRHSRAKKIQAEVEYLPRGLRLLVSDDGRGMDPKVLSWGRDSHWGLLGMQERAASIGAKLRMWSRPGGGTELELFYPWKHRGHLT